MRKAGMSIEHNDAKLVPLVQLAGQIHVPRSWLKREAEEGRLPCLKAGSALLFHAPTVERLLAERAGRDSDLARPGHDSADLDREEHRDAP
jgi:hypothetical protein